MFWGLMFLLIIIPPVHAKLNYLRLLGIIWFYNEMKNFRFGGWAEPGEKIVVKIEQKNISQEQIRREIGMLWLILWMLVGLIKYP